jgi:hypothetical protein
MGRIVVTEKAWNKPSGGGANPAVTVHMLVDSSASMPLFAVFAASTAPMSAEP